MLVRAMLLVAVLLLRARRVATGSASQEARIEAAEVDVAHLGVGPESVRVTDEYTSDHNGVTHVYLRQIEDGVDVAGADATVNVQDGIVIYSGSRFVDSSELSGEQVVSAHDAREIASAAITEDGADVLTAPHLLYRVLDDGRVRLVYDVEIQTPTHWWTLSVDAENGKLVHRYDYVDSENMG